MFDMIGKLFDIAVWVVAIFMFVGCILVSIIDIFKGSTGTKILAVISLGICATIFFMRLPEAKSMADIGISMFYAGLGGSWIWIIKDEGKQPARKEEKGPSLLDAAVDTMVEFEFMKEAGKAAIREELNKK